MKPRFDSINTIEVVQVRLFDTNDGSKVVGIFLREAGSSPLPLQAAIYQSPTVQNDWSICFWRADSGNLGFKSPEAVRCAETLRPLGFVDHSVWQQVTEINARKKLPDGGKTDCCSGLSIVAAGEVEKLSNRQQRKSQQSCREIDGNGTANRKKNGGTK